MLVSQDQIRLDMQDVRTASNNDSIKLLDLGLKLGRIVIPEGILDR